MKLRLLLAVICIFTLPMWFSIAPNKTAMNSVPFATVAFAGHTIMTGVLCECDSSEDCICNPGEKNVHSQNANKPSANGNALSGAAATEFDAGASVLLVALALLLGLRVRF